MGFYQEKVLPHILDKAMNTKVEREIRGRVCEGLHGEVVEIGFGSGHNVPYYPPEVTKLSAVEPSAVSMRLAEPRIAKSPVVIELAGLDGQRLDLPSEQFDAALSTWTLCTIPDIAAALAEVRRVLKPGGTFHFAEHGHAPDAGVARWQERLDPLEMRIAGGCHLTRKIADDIESSGFLVKELSNYYAKGAPKPWSYTFEGRAVKS